MTKSAMLGWAAGAHGTSVMIGVMTFFLLNYMTDNLGIGILLASQIIFIVRLYDLATDPIMGVISDRTQTSIGRRRPYLLVGAVASFVTFVLLFNVPTFGNAIATASYVTIILILYSTAYTIFNVPHLAMPAEMVSGYHERTVLMSFRVIFFITALLVLSIGGGQVLDRMGEADGYPVLGWGIGATVLVTMLLAFLLTRGTSFSERTASTPHTVTQQIQLIWENRHFRIFIVAKLFLLTANASFSVAFLFFAKYALERGPELMISLGIFQTLGTLGSIPVWSFISKRIGKRNALIVTAIGYSCVMSTWLLATPLETALVLNVRILCIGFFTGGIVILGFAILPDTIEYDRLKSGINREGVYSGIYSTIEKIASAFGALIFGAYLAANGFTSSQAGEQVAQSDAAVRAIYNAIGLFPALAVLSAAVVIWFYRLDEQTLKSMAAKQTP